MQVDTRGLLIVSCSREVWRQPTRTQTSLPSACMARRNTGLWIDRSRCDSRFLRGSLSPSPRNAPPLRVTCLHEGRVALSESPRHTCPGCSLWAGEASVSRAAVVSQATTAEPIPSESRCSQGRGSLQQCGLKRPQPSLIKSPISLPGAGGATKAPTQIRNDN